MREPLPHTRHGRFAASLAIALAVATGAAAAAEIDWDTPDKQWRSGPVKYLLTKDEVRDFKKLKTDEEMKRFVDEFWAQRDPTPGTPENEYREFFYNNAREAAARFSEDGGKGWQDDRGRVFILLGTPNDVVESEGLFASDSASRIDNPTTSGTGPAGSPGAGDQPPDIGGKTIRFIYLENPLTGEGRLELSFISDVTGGFRLQDKLDWEDPVLRGLAPPKTAAPAAVAQAQPAADAPAPAGQPGAFGANELPVEVAAPPTPQSELMELVRSDAPPSSSIPLEVKTNYYMAADESTAATITIEVDRESLPEGVDPDSLVVSAEILDPESNESVQRFFHKEQFGVYDAAGAPVLFQSQRSLYPGKYRAIFAVKEPGGKIGSLEQQIEVPGYDDDGLTLSSVTLAHKLEPLAAPPAGDAPAPFVLGGLRVVPRLHNVFRHGEHVLWYYQIYGAAQDPAGKFNLDISYAIEKKQGTRWVMLGGRPLSFPGKTERVQGYGFPIQPAYPAGEYRVGIKVKDTVGGGEAQTEIPFMVEGEDKTAEAGK